MQPLATQARVTVDPALLPRIILWSVIIGSLTYTAADPDLWGHVRFGLDSLETGAISTVDPYSFTSDRPWLNHEWLSEVAMGAAYRIGGQLGLALLKSMLVLVTVLLISRDLALAWRTRGST